MKSSAPGSDNVHIEMIKPLNAQSKEILLKFYNIIWNLNEIPDEWRKARILPLLKPQKKSPCTPQVIDLHIFNKFLVQINGKNE